MISGSILQDYITILNMLASNNSFNIHGSVGKESACNARDLGSIPGLGGFPGGGHGNPFQYSCLENPHGWKTWWATVHGVSKRWTQLSDKAQHRRYIFFIKLKNSILFLVYWGFFIVNGYWILSNIFSASINMIVWFFFLSWLTEWVTLIDFQMLTQSCIPGKNFTWSWHIILLVHYWIYILLRIFVCVFIADILVYSFLFLQCLCLILILG